MPKRYKTDTQRQIQKGRESDRVSETERDRERVERTDTPASKLNRQTET